MASVKEPGVKETPKSMKDEMWARHDMEKRSREQSRAIKLATKNMKYNN